MYYPAARGIVGPMQRPDNSDDLKDGSNRLGAAQHADNGAREQCAGCPVLSNGLTRDSRSGQPLTTTCIFRRTHVFENQVLYSEASPADQLFALRSGLVKIVRTLENGKERIIRIIFPGTIFGFEILGSNSHSASAVVIKESSICSVGREELLAFLRESPEGAVRFMGVLANDVTRFSTEITHMSFKDARSKVATLLRSLIGPEDTRTSNSVVLTLPFSFQEIGEILELSPETVSRSWGVLQRDGIIKKRGRKVTVLDLVRLEEATRR